MMTPVLVATESASAKFVSWLSGGNRRNPVPSTTGWILQDEFVHEITAHERLDEDAAAKDDEPMQMFLLEPGDRIGGIALQQHGVLPRQRLGQGR